MDLESLGPLLGQIVVALRPLVDAYPKEVSSIFEFLIFKNKYAYSHFFPFHGYVCVALLRGGFAP